MPPPPSSIIKMTTGKPKICAYVQVSADLNTQIHRRKGIKKAAARHTDQSTPCNSSATDRIYPMPFYYIR